MSESEYSDIKKDLNSLKIGNYIQTASVIIFFVFGISTLAEIIKRIK